MRKTTDRYEAYRVQVNPYRSPEGALYGLFEIPYRSHRLMVLSSPGNETGWDHVSVSLKKRCPNWEEMSFVKDLFFEEDETVVQFHPKRSEYVNMAPFCLHLWRPIDEEVRLPPKILTGF